MLALTVDYRSCRLRQLKVFFSFRVRRGTPLCEGALHCAKVHLVWLCECALGTLREGALDCLMLMQGLSDSVFAVIV